MVTYTLTTPVNVGTLTAPVNVSSLAITGVNLCTKPALAPLGTAQLTITLTDTVSGWQETIFYQDASVVAFFNSPAPTPATGETMQDVMASAIFAKLVADGKLPPGTISTVS
jgi:hypothetical protein